MDRTNPTWDTTRKEQRAKRKMKKANLTAQQQTAVKIFFFLLFAAFGFVPVQAQWVKSFSVGTIYDDNAFRTYAAKPDYVTQLSGYLAKEHSGERWQSRIFYRGNYNLFGRYSERNYFFQQAGVALTRPALGGKKRDALFLGANGVQRVNRALYNYYNLAEATAFVNAKLYLAPASFTQFGYRWRGRWYSNLESFSYAEHFLFARLTHSFPSRTTLVLETNYGRKIYLQQTSTVGIDSPTGNNWHYGEHGGGMGRMWNGGGSDNGAMIPSSRPQVGQWVALLRVAQSLTANTGLSGEFTVRRNHANAVRYLAGQVAGYTSEDELFDDRYGYESEEVSLNFTQLLPWQMSLKLGGEVQWKNYPNRPALDLAGNPLTSGELRDDRRITGWIALSKSLILSENGKSLDLVGEYNLIDNQSNDRFYDFRSGAVTVGVGMKF